MDEFLAEEEEGDLLPEMGAEPFAYLVSSVSDAQKTDRSESKLRTVFDHLEARAKSFGDAYPFKVEHGRVLKAYSDLNPIHQLYVSLLVSSNLRLATSSGVARIGNLFEKICGPYFKMLIPPESECHHFGAAAGSGELFAGGLAQKVETLCSVLETRKSLRATESALPTSGDGGLDWIAYRKFSENDLAWNIPTFFAQCACGQNWTEKQDEASREVWETLIDLPFPSTTFLFTPRSPRSENNRFEQAYNVQNKIVLVDRHRFLALGQKNDAAVQDALSLFRPIHDELGLLTRRM